MPAFPTNAQLRSAVRNLAEETSTKPRNLSRWVQAKEVLFTSLANRHRSGGVRSAQFPEREDQLFMLFLYRRTVQGLAVNGKWLCIRMRELVLEFETDDVAEEYPTSGWLKNWKKRYQVQSMYKTNNQPTTIQQRLPAIKKFHKFFQEKIVAHLGVAPEQIFYMDQIPVPYVQANAARRTLNVKGTSCHIKSPYKGAEKRLLTMQVLHLFLLPYTLVAFLNDTFF